MYSHEIVKDYNLTLKYVGYHILRTPNILRKPKTQFWKRVVVGKSRERKKSWQRKPFKYFLSDCRRQQSVLWLAVPYAAHKQIHRTKKIGWYLGFSSLMSSKIQYCLHSCLINPDNFGWMNYYSVQKPSEK